MACIHPKDTLSNGTRKKGMVDLVEIAVRIEHSVEDAKLRGDPVVCPQTVSAVGSIFGLEPGNHPNTTGIVRVLKCWLRRLGVGHPLNPQFVGLLYEHLQSEELRYETARQEHASAPITELQDLLSSLASGTETCSNCERKTAQVLCEACVDLYCPDCSSRIHRKGKRSRHRYHAVQQCQFSSGCGNRAVLECTVTGEPFCSSCYVNRHIHSIVMERRTPPRRIDYMSYWKDNISLSNVTLPSFGTEAGNDWYPFYDRDGVLYHFNFRTGEAQRRSPMEMFEDEDQVPDEQSDVSIKLDKIACLPFKSPFR